MSMLALKNLTVRYGGLTIVDGVSFAVEPGQWLMIVGPNGAGKTTVLSAVTQSAPYTGQVLLEGQDVKRIKPRLLARRMGLLSQSHPVGYAFTVEEVVRLGRYAYRSGPLSGRADPGADKVAEAIARVGLVKARDQSVLTLSGGELQRAFLAQLFAQDPSLLLLDEPTNHLDLVYQKQVFTLIQEWLKTPGRAVVSVVHDLSLARIYGTHALLLEHGKAVAQGDIDSVLTKARLNQVYRMDVYAWMQDMYKVWA